MGITTGILIFRPLNGGVYSGFINHGSALGFRDNCHKEATSLARTQLYDTWLLGSDYLTSGCLAGFRAQDLMVKGLTGFQLLAQGLCNARGSFLLNFKTL